MRWLLILSLLWGLLPTQQTTFTVAGLDGEIRIHWDDYGIPHIYAESIHDLFFGQGFVHAADRWWQMDYRRHQGAGELAALMGESALEEDIYLRTLGLRRNAENDWNALSPETQSLLEAYADGVNAWLADKTPAELAVEYGYL